MIPLLKTLLALACVVSTAGLLSAGDEVVIDNPAFDEPFTNGFPRDWYRVDHHGNQRQTFSASSEGRGGTSCQLITIDEALAGWAHLGTVISGGITAGRDYEARVWLKSDRFVHEASLAVHAEGYFPFYHAEVYCELGSEWREYVLRFRATRDDAKARLAVKIGAEARVWVDDAAIRELPAAERPGVPAGNLLANGSFEVGIAGWSGKHIVPVIQEDAKAPHGDVVVHLPGGPPARALESSAFPAPWGRTVQISLSARSDPPAELTVVLAGAKQPLIKERLALSRTWARYTVAATVTPQPDGLIHLELIPGAAYQWLDAVQIEVGDAPTPFRPRSVIEVGLAGERADAVYAPGEALGATLRWWNDGPAARVPAGTALRLRDVWERVVAEPALPLTSLPPGRSTAEVGLTTRGRSGVFRLDLERGTPTVPVPLAETVLAVVPDLTGVDRRRPFGTHIDYGGAKPAVRAGFGWTKSWLLNWSSARDGDGWRFPQEKQVDGWIAAGLTPLAILSEAPRELQARPAEPAGWGWYSSTDLAAQQEYARQLARQYAGRIDTWELQNEPDHAVHPLKGQTSAQAYAREAYALAAGVRAGNPQAKVILGSVTVLREPSRWIAEVLDAEPRLSAVCDQVSLHLYRAEPAALMRVFDRMKQTLRSRSLAWPIWDTEWSPVNSTRPFLRLLRRHLGPSQAGARRVAAMLVHGAVTRLGEGIHGNFLYLGMNRGDATSSPWDHFLEQDGQARPAFVAQAVLTRELAGATTLGRVELPNAWAWDFRRPDGRRVRVAWQSDTATQAPVLDVPAGATVIDLMGNPLAVPPGGRLVLTDDPVYVVSAGG